MTLIEYFDRPEKNPLNCLRILREIDELENVINDPVSYGVPNSDAIKDCKISLENLRIDLADILKDWEHEEELNIHEAVCQLAGWIDNNILSGEEAKARIEDILIDRESLLSSFTDEDFTNNGDDDDDDEQRERFNKLREILDDLRDKLMIIKVDGIDCDAVYDAWVEANKYVNECLLEVKYNFITDYSDALMEAINKYRREQYPEDCIFF